MCQTSGLQLLYSFHTFRSTSIVICFVHFEQTMSKLLLSDFKAEQIFLVGGWVVMRKIDLSALEN